MAGEVLFLVKATVDTAQADAFDHWYNVEHAPSVLQVPGCRSARRFVLERADSEERFEWLAVYEFESEAAYLAFEASPFRAELRLDYDRRFGQVSERVHLQYRQVWP